MSTCSSDCYSASLQIINSIQGNTAYSTLLAPNIDFPTGITIYLDFVLIKTLELTNSGALTVVAALYLVWYDPRLAWTPSDYNNVSLIALTASDVWTPSFLVRTGLTESLTIKADPTQLLSVAYTGKVDILVTKKISVSCTLDLTNFPYDSHNCSIPIMYFGQQLSFYPTSSEVNMATYSPTGEFQLIGSYIDSEDSGFCTRGVCYPVLIVNLAYSRLPIYYIMNVIAPACLLSIVLAFAFIIPSDNSVKIAMACSLMTSLYVTQQNVSRVLPATSVIPNVAIGIIAALILGCLCVITNVITVTLRMNLPTLSSGFVRSLSHLTCLLCMIKPNKVEDLATNNNISAEAKHTINVKRDMEAVPVNNSSDEHAMFLKRICDLLEDQARYKIQKRNKDIKKAEQTHGWRILDSIINAFLLVTYFIAAMVVVIVYEFQSR